MPHGSQIKQYGRLVATWRANSHSGERSLLGKSKALRKTGLEKLERKKAGVAFLKNLEKQADLPSCSAVTQEASAHFLFLFEVLGTESRASSGQTKLPL